MLSCLLVLFVLLSLFQAHIVQAQNSSAVCTEGYKWAFNSGRESPCDVAAKFMEPCRGEGYTVDPLTPGASYWGPWKGPDTRCMCSTVTWAIFSACGICQNGTAISWNAWSYNCSNVTATSPPLRTSHQVDIPRWAYLDIGVDGKWNETAARVEKGLPWLSDKPDDEIGAGWVVLAVLGSIALTVVISFLLVLCLWCWDPYSTINERRRLKRTPEPGDVTTELATAPGDAPSGP